MKNRLAALLLLATTAFAGCSGAGSNLTPGSSQTDGSHVLSVSHYSDAAGDHRVVQFTLTANGKTLMNSMDEVRISTSEEQIKLTQNGIRFDALITTDGSKHTTEVRMSRNGTLIADQVFRGVAKEVSDAGVSGALASVMNAHRQDTTTSAGQRKPMFGWFECGVGCGLFVEFEGPFVVACMAACMSFSMN